MTHSNVYSDAYKRAYSRGWTASRRYTGLSPVSPLERADDRNEPSAWYDGYHDYAADRPKFNPLIHGTREDYFRKFYSEEI